MPDGAIPSGNFRYTRTKDSMGLYVFALDWSHKNKAENSIEIPLKIKGYVSLHEFEGGTVDFQKLDLPVF